MAQLVRRVCLMDQRMEMREPVFMWLCYEDVAELDACILPKAFPILGEFLSILANGFLPLLLCV